MRLTHVAIVVLGLSLVYHGLKERRAAAKEPTLPDWQLVGAQAACFEVGDRLVLRLTDGVTVNTVARLKVAHIDRQLNVVTFVERQP